MLVIIALVFLLFTPGLMILIRLLRPRFAYQYLLALLSALISWPLIMLSHPDTYVVIPLFSWQPESLFPYSPNLLLDRYSWPFALALSTIVLSVMLTEVARLNTTNWRTWAGSLLLTGFGLLAVLAGNPLTLLIAWAALDIIEAGILMIQAKDPSVRQKIILVLSARAAGIVALLVAMIVVWSSGESLNFLTIQPQAALLLMVAAALRLGILPLHLPLILETQYRRGLGTTLRLVPVGASLILIVRTAASGVDPQVVPWLLVLLAIIALYGAAAWVMAPDELSGRTFWTLGMVSFSVSASFRAQPEASIAWGIACLLSGSLVFLAAPRNRYLMPLLYLGVLSISSLPFTPLWNGWQAYGVLQRDLDPTGLILDFLVGILFFITHILLILGYLRHTSRQSEPVENVERWIWVLYLPGLAILLVADFIYGIYYLPEINAIPPAGWLSGAIVSIVSLLLWIRGRSLLKKFDSIPQYFSRLEPVLYLSWLYRLLEGIYRTIGRLVTLVSNILEGEGGLLWTMLIILLLFSLIRL
jgi:formate hydrogenlyase subunit 3/multisubunit Na+/H+ antiporter MnhD subunit